MQGYCIINNVYLPTEGEANDVRYLKRNIPMDFNALLAQLRTEREMIEEAIMVLERLARGGKRRGRPPKWLTEHKTDTVPETPPEPKKKRAISEEARQRMAEAQRRRWAAAKKTEE